MRKRGRHLEKPTSDVRRTMVEKPAGEVVAAATSTVVGSNIKAEVEVCPSQKVRLLKGNVLLDLCALGMYSYTAIQSSNVALLVTPGYLVALALYNYEKYYSNESVVSLIADFWNCLPKETLDKVVLISTFALSFGVPIAFGYSAVAGLAVIGNFGFRVALNNFILESKASDAQSQFFNTVLNFNYALFRSASIDPVAEGLASFVNSKADFGKFTMVVAKQVSTLICTVMAEVFRASDEKFFGLEKKGVPKKELPSYMKRVFDNYLIRGCARIGGDVWESSIGIVHNSVTEKLLFSRYAAMKNLGDWLGSDWFSQKIIVASRPNLLESLPSFLSSICYWGTDYGKERLRELGLQGLPVNLLYGGSRDCAGFVCSKTSLAWQALKDSAVFMTSLFHIKPEVIAVAAASSEMKLVKEADKVSTIER